MITEKDLQEAIAECEGQRNPNANTCIKLAAYHVLLDHLHKDTVNVTPQSFIDIGNSYSSGPDVIDYTGNSEFSELVHGMDQYKVMSIMDELMTTLQVLNPRLYNSVLRKISDGG